MAEIRRAIERPRIERTGLRISLRGTDNIATNLADNSVGASGYGYFGALQGSEPFGERRVVGVTASSISVGQRHGLALVGGQVWAWGSNAYGQLGDGTGDDRATPVRSGTLSGIVAISAGMEHSLALDGNGRVYAWGQGDAGQLGLGSSANKATPTRIDTLTNVEAISAGHSFSLALKTDGTVSAWGSNAFGRLGLGASVVRKNSPTKIPALGATDAISAGYSHALAIGMHDEVFAWGDNTASQLGDGTTQDRPTPVRAVGLSGVTRIAAGEGHSLAVGPDGIVYAWGMNRSRQLGDGGVIGKAIPTPIPDLPGMVDVAAGMGESFAIDGNGGMWAWGEGAGPTAPSELDQWTDVQQVAACKVFYAVLLSP